MGLIERWYEANVITWEVREYDLPGTEKPTDGTQEGVVKIKYFPKEIQAWEWLMAQVDKEVATLESQYRGLEVRIENLNNKGLEAANKVRELRGTGGS